MESERIQSGHMAQFAKRLGSLGTIPLRQHIFGLFLTNPPYVSIKSTENSHFSDPATQFICWHNKGMVPKS